jgi:hypothetical protein
MYKSYFFCKSELCDFLSTKRLSTYFAIYKGVSEEFDIHVTMHHDKFLIIKPTRCTNFSSIFLEWNSTCFGQFLCPSSRVFHCTHSNGTCVTGLQTACKQDQDGIPSWSCSNTVSKPVWRIPFLCLQLKTPDDGHRNWPKLVEFHSKIILRN